jgi:hypothetical protein
MVCAIGAGGWNYIGPVIATDAAARTYTILPVPSNRILDNLKQYQETLWTSPRTPKR